MSTNYEKKQELLREYQIDDIETPKVILRNVKKVDGDIYDDDLCEVIVDINDGEQNFSKQLPQEFQWAKRALARFKESYSDMLKNPLDRVHLQSIKGTRAYIIIEDRCSTTKGNGLTSSYSGAYTSVCGRSAILLVGSDFKKTTFLHEAIHLSDMGLPYKSFEDLKLYQAAIMMIDAQKIQKPANNQTVQALRVINKIYKQGELYTEGLAWISSMPLATLSKEKNHIGKNLKILHALYTKAIHDKQKAVIQCFQYFSPSVHVQSLLEEYNDAGQKIGQNRDKILKQEKHFWDEMMKLRKDMNKLKNKGLEKDSLSDGQIRFCEMCAFNSIVPAFFAQKKAKDLLSQTEDDKRAQIKTLKVLLFKIEKEHLKDSSIVAESLLSCYFYMQKTFPEVAQKLTSSCFLYNDTEITKKMFRKRFYEAMKKGVDVIEKAEKTKCSEEDCEMAYDLGVTPETVRAISKLVQTEMLGKNISEKRDYVENLIEDYEQNKESNENCLKNLKAVLGMKRFLKDMYWHQHLHGALEGSDIQDFKISKKILQDMKFLKTDKDKDGLPLAYYEFFALGTIADLCQRSADCFDKESVHYIPNNYHCASQQETACARALYSLLALRHFIIKKKIPITEKFKLVSFKPSSDKYVRQLKALEDTSSKNSGKGRYGR